MNITIPKIPLGIPTFSTIIQQRYLYVDKTLKLFDLIENRENYIIYRQKGFGKSLTLSTLKSIFSGEKELFKGLSAYSLIEEYASRPTPVLYFKFLQIATSSIKNFENSFDRIINKLSNEYSIDIRDTSLQNKISHLIEEIYKKYGHLAILIDDYDLPILNSYTNNDVLFFIQKTLKEFYETIESYNEYIRFTCIAGSEKSYEGSNLICLRNGMDITNDEYYTDIIGFTIDEIKYYFADYIKYISSSRSIPEETLWSQLMYIESNNSESEGRFLFNPQALIKCLIQGDISSYNSYTYPSQKMFSCLNPGDSDFIAAKNSKIYVDKSELLIYTNEFINTVQKYICISRPRRFGKTIAANMLASYYDLTGNAKVAFKGLKIQNDQSFCTHANKYIVIKINIQIFLSQTHEINTLIAKITSTIHDDLIKEFDAAYISDDINLSLKAISNKTQKKFVIVVDEWDCIFREFRKNKEWQEQYLDFLRYIFKDQEHIALVYMTGILPIKKYGTHSALNMFSEFSMLNAHPFTEFVGFTEDEVKKLCKSFKRDFNQCKAWYDGYTVNTCVSIYNPRSVIEYIIRGVSDTYWNNTETYEALQVYITMDYYGLRETIIKLLSNDYEKINTRTFTNDMRTFASQDDVLTLLVHLGYLSYNASNQTVHIPNKEISYEFVSAIQNKGWPKVVQAIKNSENLLKAVLAKDHEAVAKGIEAVHLETSILTYNDENALAYTISLAFYAAREFYTIVREFPTGKGFADCVFLPREKGRYPILCVELKWNKSANSAITQILEKNYPASLLNQSDPIILVGINYNIKTKKHTCSIKQIDHEKTTDCNK
ncbi:MAG: AAA family ATPase [Desulfovibrio sp.]|nr:AAA family ATPase [Desulfovibrio sp.]